MDFESTLTQHLNRLLRFELEGEPTSKFVQIQIQSVFNSLAGFAIDTTAYISTNPDTIS